MSALFPNLTSRDDAALIIAGAPCSPAELTARLRCYLGHLSAHAVPPGARVAVVMRYGLDAVIATLGNILHGAVTVPLNPKLGIAEREHILADSSPVLVVDPDTGWNASELPGPLPQREVDNAPLLVLYTSGTTGAPKGAVLTAANVASNLDALAQVWQWTARDRVVHALPLFHVHGLALGLLGSLRVGGSFCWTRRCTAPELTDAIGDGATMLFAVPTMYHRLADAAESDRQLADALGSLRLMISGSAGLPVREHRRIQQLCNRGVYERYGLTETLINCAVPVTGPPRPGWVGPPLPGLELELRNVGDEGIGEVFVRGPNLFAGYLHRPPPGSDDWFDTGDLALRADDGAIRIVGRRATDLIKTGGYKVGAGEVEACLLELPQVAEVAVVGLPDDDLGERITAFVVLRSPAEQPPVELLMQQVADQLSPHKRPREVRYVDELPRNAMGKVQKRRLMSLG